MDPNAKSDALSLTSNSPHETATTAIIFNVVNKRVQRTITTFLLFTTVLQISIMVGVLSSSHHMRALGPTEFALFSVPIMMMFALVILSAWHYKGSLVLNAEGIQFSKAFRLELLNRLKRDWSDLHSVQIVYPDTLGRTVYPIFADDRFKWSQIFFANSVGPKLCLDFNSGGSASLNLNNVTRAQAEKLFDAFERYSDPSRFSTDFVKIQKALIMERLDPVSFTQIWAEDIKPRYCATNYVPLPTNHTLDDGRYKVLLELAAGGMSAVYLARNESGGKVVLKESVIPSDISSEQKAKATELFEREAHLLLKLKHPKIARVLDRFVDADRDYLVLEYIPGLTLRQLVAAKGKQKEKDVLKWAKQISEILVYLHGQSPPLLHRDLTPDNIILKEDGSIFLVDFGAANEFIGQATGTMIGKQCYISPEQLRGKANQTSDLYALGATLYFLLAGEDPEPLSCSRLQDKIPAVSKTINDLVVSLTAFESEERPQSAKDVLNILEHPGTAGGGTPSATTLLNKRDGEQS